MEAYDFRRFHGFIKIAINRLTNHDAEFIHILALGMNAIAKGTGVESAVHLVFAHFKDDFAHDRSLTAGMPFRKVIARTASPWRGL
jgi:hypothetical protein